jgi:hypothetical protein
MEGTFPDVLSRHITLWFRFWQESIRVLWAFRMTAGKTGTVPPVIVPVFVFRGRYEEFSHAFFSDKKE